MKLPLCVGPCALAAAITLPALNAPATAQDLQQRPTVSPAEQARLDSDRIRILGDELQREQSRVEGAARDRAARLAAGDHAGHEAANAAHTRAVANVAAIQQEIEAARAATRHSPPTQPRSRPTARRAPTSPAWWDVYAQRPSPHATETTP